MNMGVFGLGFLLGAVVAAVFAAKLLLQKQGEMRNAQAGVRDAENAARSAAEKTTLLEERLRAAEQERQTLIENHRKLEEQSAELRRQSQAQFENLAQKILDQNTRKFQESGEKNLKDLLNPLKERLQAFEKKVDDTYRHDTQERSVLKHELERLAKLNQQMSQEAQNLTRALKADVKMQGNWGELILERLLSDSGLRAGEEYTTQGSGMGLKGSEGETLKPDVVINLPDGKHLIIDSKVSLKAYEAYANATEDGLRDGCLKELLTSVYKHVDGLASKHYSSLEGLRCPDFVFLFMPLEPAFALTLQSDKELVAYAWNKRVAFVSPTTLLVTLGTVASLWKTERQNRNALEIARQGGALYDKFVAFTTDLDRIGRTLGDAQRTYDEAVAKLHTGRGNLVARVETLRKLGAKSTKELSEKFSGEEALAAPEPETTDADKAEVPQQTTLLADTSASLR